MATFALHAPLHRRLPLLTTGRSEETLRSLLAEADIRVGGDRPWDIRVLDARFYEHVLRHGSLGLGEAYMDGWWDADRPDDFIFLLLRTGIAERATLDLPSMARLALARVINLQTKRRATAVAERHYNLGNDFYEAMLDPFLQYSCAYFDRADTLAEAQVRKMDLMCRKLQLQEADRVLDIGCGWGGLAKFMAERYGAVVTGVTIAEEQATYARRFCHGLPVTILPQDYRDVQGTYDRIVSVGMFEHVGAKNYRTFMETAERCLADDGLFLLHCIGRNASGYGTDPWIERYIFPNSMLPSPAQVNAAAEELFTLEDWHNFGAQYDRTLMEWHANFTAHWPAFSDRYGERFERMWRYYLLSCAGAFRARGIHLWQMVFSKRGVLGGYASVR